MIFVVVVVVVAVAVAVAVGVGVGVVVVVVCFERWSYILFIACSTSHEHASEYGGAWLLFHQLEISSVWKGSNRFEFGYLPFTFFSKNDRPIRLQRSQNLQFQPLLPLRIRQTLLPWLESQARQCFQQGNWGEDRFASKKTLHCPWGLGWCAWSCILMYKEYNMCQGLSSLWMVIPPPQ